MDAIRQAATVLDGVARVARVRPEVTAVEDGDTRLTYGQLWQQAGTLADVLRDRGIGNGDRVGLCLPRSASLVSAAVGITAAGAAYVALDPDTPVERLVLALRDAGAAALVVDPSHPLAARCGLPVLQVGGPVPDAAVPAEAAAERATPGPSDIAYLVYTSGSTGRPKGVEIEHRSLANLVSWHVESFGVSTGDRCSLLASPGFDASVWETWPSLTVGATLVVVPPDLKTDPIGLRDWLVTNAITVAFVPTAVVEPLLALEWSGSCALRVVLTGGSALHTRPRPGLPFTLVNNYGVSEATVVSTSGIVEPEEEPGPESVARTDGAGAGQRLPDIGAAISNVDLSVEGEDGQPVGVGEIGELVVRGVSVARGYVGEAAATFDGVYRTGDLVRQRPDGRLDYIGRKDDQVQISGVRVEPAEVAAVIGGDPAVRGCAVLPDESGHRLIAYLVGEPDPAQLRDRVSAALPPQMIPADYITVREIPLTLNGKVDAAALRAFANGAATRSESTADVGGAPQGEIEPIVADLVAELLKVESVGRDQNFFLLGGHSLLGAQLIARLGALFSIELSLRLLFDNPTVAGLSAAVERTLIAEVNELSPEDVRRALADDPTQS